MTFGTPALLFGAIALIMLAYTNRFFILARLIRDMHAGVSQGSSDLERRQIPILRTRIRLIQWMQALGVFSFLLCTFSMFLLFLESEWLGKLLFGASVVCLMLSLFFSLWEVLISTKALDMVLDDFDKRNHD